jgi:hypothetical protein
MSKSEPHTPVVRKVGALMSESVSTGRISGIDSFDYVSEYDGFEARGCMATMTTDDGTSVVVWTQSMRLQPTLEMAYATQRRFAIEYFDNDPEMTDEGAPMRRMRRMRDPEPLGFLGPFELKIVGTVE